MRVFITGIAGFAGSHLADSLAAKGSFSIGGLHHPGDRLDNLASVRDAVELFAADLLDRASIRSALSDFRPDAVVHLAAVAFVPSDPNLLKAVNVEGSRNLIKVMLEICPEASGIFISSSEVYGLIEHGSGPVDESHPVVPISDYAKSKLEMEVLVRRFHKLRGLRHLILRPFNHIGPRQSPDFVIASFASQIARIEAGRQEPVLRVGSLETRRDFTDVRDMAEAYARALTAPVSEKVFNIASGRSQSIREALDLLLSQSEVPIKVLPDPARMRRSDNPEIVGNAEAFTKMTGWKRALPFEDSLRDCLNYWRSLSAI